MRSTTGVAAGMLVAASVHAADVAFWSEYDPVSHDSDQTYLLLPFNTIAPAIPVGRPARAAEGRFGSAMRFDGRSALRYAQTNLFEGERISIHAFTTTGRINAC